MFKTTSFANLCPRDSGVGSGRRKKIVFVFSLSEAEGVRVQKGVHSSRVGGIDG